MAIDGTTSPAELAARVSQALEAAGIKATLSGGGAVGIYSENQYQSKDLDFVTSARAGKLAAALAPLGFALARDKRHFEHPATDLFLEFPAAPLGFGSRIVQHDDIPLLQTPFGPLRVITPTQCVMDRLAAFWHWNDRQSWDQAVMVSTHCEVDFEDLAKFAKEERADPREILRLRQQAGK